MLIPGCFCWRWTQQKQQLRQDLARKHYLCRTTPGRTEAATSMCGSQAQATLQVGAAQQEPVVLWQRAIKSASFLHFSRIDIRCLPRRELILRPVLAQVAHR